MDKDEVMLHNFDNIQELIRFVDQKAGALLIIYGLIFTATIEFSKDLKFINPFVLKSGWDKFQSILLFLDGVLILGLLIFQIYFILFEIIKPRQAKNYTQEEISVLYFDHISKRSKEQFITHFENTTDADIQKEMLGQIYEISCILSKKSEKFNYILIYLFGTIFCLLLFIYLSKIV
jgi:hypothetical protein